MAYAQIKVEIFEHRKTKRAARALGISPAAFVGHYAALLCWAWTNAPDGVLLECDPIDIAEAARLSEMTSLMTSSVTSSVTSPVTSPVTPEKFVEVLVATRWLAKVDGDLVINDWFEHTGKILLDSMKNKNRQERYRKNRKEKVVIPARDDVIGDVIDDVTGDAREHPILDQIRSDQRRNPGSTIRGAEQLAATLPGAATPRKRSTQTTTEGSQVWDAYVLAMQTGWNSTPPRSSKTASCAKKLVALVGIDRAIQLAAYYPTRRKAYYVERGHPFELLVTDYMAMLRELDAGLKMTPEIVKDLCSREQSENYIAAEKAGVVNSDPFGLPVGTEEEVRRLGEAHS